jgi:diamine N-acetyltransferase
MNAQETILMMNTDLKIEKIGVDKTEVVIKLANAIWPAVYSGILPAEQISYMMELFYSRSSLEKQMTEKQHQFIIALSEGHPIAFASYGALEDVGAYKLHKIYVLTDFHGKGIGKALMDFIINELETANARLLELNVNRNNKAKAFYEKLCFEVIREEDIDIGNGYYMNDYVMRKMI